jgi:hypothetical protein
LAGDVSFSLALNNSVDAVSSSKAKLVASSVDLPQLQLRVGFSGIKTNRRGRKKVKKRTIFWTGSHALWMGWSRMC